jgi:hypothetical protein
VPVVTTRAAPPPTRAPVASKLIMNFYSFKKSILAKPMQQHQQKISPSVHRPAGGGHHIDPHHGSHGNDSIRLQHEV